MVELNQYTEGHRAELEQLLETPQWRQVLSSALLKQAAAEKLSPGATRGFIDTVVNQLVAFNEPAVAARIARGCRDELVLLDAFSRWPAELDGRPPVISFLGLNVTSHCNFWPRCAYCNQHRPREQVGLAAWRSALEEATADGHRPGPYVYITGGEPLLLEEGIWGQEGLVRFATQRGAGVNVNTNGTMLTPEVAVRLVASGLAKLHVSLDAPDPLLHRRLRGGERLDDVLRGIYNVQLARDLLGVTHPVIHTNCVLTRHNLRGFPRLISFILEKRKQAARREDPFREDLLPHVIPVGGDGNAPLRPAAGEFREFYESIWQEVCEMWQAYQDGLGIPRQDHRELFGYFSNPFLRVGHRGGLDSYVRASAEGRYGRLALSRHCYVAPTQAALTPDGNQYRCGCHAIRRALPIGNIARRGLFQSIRAGVEGLESLPQERHCYGCALATLYINQSVEAKLKEKLAEMLRADGRA